MKEVRVVSLASDMSTGLPLHFYKTLSKKYVRVSKLWSAQDFGFRGDNYITKKKVKIVYHACVTVLLLISTNIIILSQTV